ncbi:MAG TPA: hypothetical protein VFB12_31870 [Ktedonobacteraceae bacterium]|nr:hypothetical protein [Ktedonobacteraceae bacterium]
MYVYYILRGTQSGKPVELEGDIDEETFPEVDLSDGPAVINAVTKRLGEESTIGEWEECDLTDSLFDREDNYIFFHGRWMRRSDAPWRKDRNN